MKWFLFSLLLSVCVSSHAKQTKADRPNIIFILADTLRSDYLGAYGFDGDVSPNIDQLAKESVLFKKCLAPSSWTKPAMATLFTALHPQTHKVTDHIGMQWKRKGERYKSNVLAEEAVTMAEIFLNEGYDTVGFVANDFMIRRFGFGQGFQRYFEPRPHADVFSATPILRKATKMLKKGKIKEPFFLYLHFMDTHGPYQCKGSDFDILKPSLSFGEDHTMNRVERARIPGELGRNVSWRGSSKGLSVKNWRNCYAAGVRKFDRRLGPFLDELKKMGVFENTILVFTSDHGEELFDHKRWAHGHSLYGEVLRIPLMIRLPKAEQAGRVVNKTVGLIDLMPTLMSAVGLGYKLQGIGGQDVSPLLYGKRMEGYRRWTFGSATRHDPNMISVKDNRFKLIWKFPKGKPKLFDLRNDPDEKKDVSKQRPQILKQMTKVVVSHMQTLKKQGTLTESATPITGDLVERLKALGYLQ